MESELFSGEKEFGASNVRGNDNWPADVTRERLSPKTTGL